MNVLLILYNKRLFSEKTHGKSAFVCRYVPKTQLIKILSLYSAYEYGERMIYTATKKKEMAE